MPYTISSTNSPLSLRDIPLTRETYFSLPREGGAQRAEGVCYKAHDLFKLLYFGTLFFKPFFQFAVKICHALVAAVVHEHTKRQTVRVSVIDNAVAAFFVVLAGCFRAYALVQIWAVHFKNQSFHIQYIYDSGNRCYTNLK